MIVHGAEIRRIAGAALLSARVDFQHPVPDVPDQLWYAFPTKYAKFLNDRGEPFAAALLLVAMYWGEDLEIRGPVSPEFAYGLNEYQKVFRAWAPEIFKEIEIEFGRIQSAQDASPPKAVATAFSGGVDSTYTLRANLAENQPLGEYRLTHGVFIHGFDIELNEGPAYRSAYQKYARLFEELGLELIPVQTNARLFSQYRMDWVMMSGGPLISAGLALSGLLRRFYVPSGYSYHEVLPNGNSPLVDHLLSTDTLEIVHHGAHQRHFEKMVEISDWEIAHHNLRVCIATPKPLDGRNCSVCNKCLSNTIRFEMLGVHDKFITFRQPFSRLSILRWCLIAEIGTPTVKEILRLASSTRRFELYFGMLLVWLSSLVNRSARALIRGLLSEEKLYRLKRRIYAPGTSRNAPAPDVFMS